MNTYNIQYRIRTVLQFWDDGYEFAGFKFQQWAFNLAKGPHGDSWVVSKDVEAVDVYEAISIFQDELFPILSMMCFIGQCAMTYYWESFLAYRKNNNTDNIFLLRYSHEVSGVPLHFDRKEQDTLQNALNFPTPEVFEYLQDANNAANYISRLSLLLMTLESIAGESAPGFTDKEYIRNEILQDDKLYDDLFSRGVGYRNKLFHGKRGTLGSDLCDKIYSCIVKYFNRKHGFKINENVIGVPRSEGGNYQIANFFLKLIDSELTLELKAIIELLDKRHDKYSIGDSKDKQLRLSISTMQTGKY